jgi:hypothetical protein
MAIQPLELIQALVEPAAYRYTGNGVLVAVTTFFALSRMRV